MSLNPYETQYGLNRSYKKNIKAIFNLMDAQYKKNNPQIKMRDNTSSVTQPKTARPNIDHLIKRILVEKRKQERINLFTFLLISVGIVIMALVLFN